MVAAGGSSSKDDAFESDVQRCIDTHGFGRYQWRLLGIAGIGWATDGMEMFVMALVLPELVRARILVYRRDLLVCLVR